MTDFTFIANVRCTARVYHPKLYRPRQVKVRLRVRHPGDPDTRPATSPADRPTAHSGLCHGRQTHLSAPRLSASDVRSQLRFVLLVLVEVGQQAERALEYLRRDEAGGQALVDLQADQHRLPDGPGLDGRDSRGELATIGTIVG